MPPRSRDFLYVDTPEPHRERTRAILSQHPEIRDLISRNPYSFLLIVSVVALQTLIAFIVRDQPWWIPLRIRHLPVLKDGQKEQGESPRDRRSMINHQ